MSNYEKRVVFFLDFLGFKDIIDNHKISVDDMLKKFNDAQFHLDYTSWIKNNNHDFKNFRKQDSKQYIQISDSMILSFALEEPSGLFYTILDIMRLQANFAALHGIFLRGGCCYGELYHEDCTIFGPAMNKVVNLEKIANFPRVIIPNTVIDICKDYSSNPHYSNAAEKKDIIDCLKMDNDGYYYIDYISYDVFGSETDSNEEWGQYMIQLKNKITKGLYEQQALDKYIWLKEKYNAALSDNLINNYEKNCDIKLSRI